MKCDRKRPVLPSRVPQEVGFTAAVGGAGLPDPFCLNCSSKTENPKLPLSKHHNPHSWYGGRAQAGGAVSSALLPPCSMRMHACARGPRVLPTCMRNAHLIHSYDSILIWRVSNQAWVCCTAGGGPTQSPAAKCRAPRGFLTALSRNWARATGIKLFWKVTYCRTYGHICILGYCQCARVFFVVAEVLWLAAPRPDCDPAHSLCLVWAL